MRATLGFLNSVNLHRKRFLWKGLEFGVFLYGGDVKVPFELRLGSSRTEAKRSLLIRSP
jgi:hypothetical protein